MKKILGWALPFLGGVLIMAFIQFNSGCESFMGMGDDGYTELDIDHKSIVKIGNQAEEVFLSGNIEDLKGLLCEESLDYLSDRIANQTADGMKAIGEAFKTREISYEGEQFAEFTYTHLGMDYTMTFWEVDVKEWKLVRF